MASSLSLGLQWPPYLHSETRWEWFPCVASLGWPFSSQATLPTARPARGSGPPRASAADSRHCTGREGRTWPVVAAAGSGPGGERTLRDSAGLDPRHPQSCWVRRWIVSAHRDGWRWTFEKVKFVYWCLVLDFCRFPVESSARSGRYCPRRKVFGFNELFCTLKDGGGWDCWMRDILWWRGFVGENQRGSSCSGTTDRLW